MTGMVILGNRSVGRRDSAIWLNTTTAMQAMRTKTGLRVAPRVRNIPLPLEPHRHGPHDLTLPHEVCAASHDLIALADPAGNLHDIAGGPAYRDHVFVGDVVRDQPDEVLVPHRDQRG